MDKEKALACASMIELTSQSSRSSARSMASEDTSQRSSTRTFSIAQILPSIRQVCTAGSLCTSLSRSLSLPSKVSRLVSVFGATTPNQKFGMSGPCASRTQLRTARSTRVRSTTSMDAASQLGSDPFNHSYFIH